MIFKKPYAFLIKRFRLIHIILSFLIGYIVFSTYNIYSFFSRYVGNVYATLNDAIPSNYINIFMILISILIIAFSLAMHLLMQKKDKPKTLYTLQSIYYILYLIGLVLYFSIFKSFESNQLSIRNAMILRDVTIIITLPQIVFFISNLIRGLGFDIKKFNFTKDLKELDLKEEDGEEFEFILGIDTYKYSRFLRKKIREFKYYILENKFMFTILVSLGAVIFTILLVLNFTVYNKTYNKNQKFTANNLTLEVNNSYLTNIDYKGQIISKDKYFLILNITFTNKSGSSTVLDLTDYVIVIDDEKIYPTLTRNSYFIDLGAGYAKDKIANDSTIDYILVYELNKDDVKSNYTLQIIDEVEYNAGTINTKSKKVTIKPLKLVKIESIKEFNLNEALTMYESVLGDSTMTLSSFEFKNKFTYNYEACVRYSCLNKTDVVTANSSKKKTLLIVNGILDIDKKSNFNKNKKTSLTFFDAFVQIKYDDNISIVSNVTPNSLTEKYILEVDEEVAKAKSVKMLITIRNKRYTINLK